MVISVAGVFRTHMAAEIKREDIYSNNSALLITANTKGHDIFRLSISEVKTAVQIPPIF